MHSNDEITTARVRRALRERVIPAVYGASVPFEVAALTVSGEPIPVGEALTGRYEPHEVGSAWGQAWGTTWFRVRGEVPREWAGQRVEAVLDLGFDVDLTGFQAEGLVHSPNGAALKAINPDNRWALVAAEVSGGERIELFIEAASNPVILRGREFRPTQEGDVLTAADTLLYATRRMDLAVFQREVFELAMDLDVLLGLQSELPAGPRRARILQALDDALDRLDPRDVAGSAAAMRAVLRPALQSPADASAHRIAAVGHAHIDSAWLWPIRETTRKVARTVSSMLALMDETDEYLYGMSSAQQYDWIRRSRPELWVRVVDAVKSGRLLPLGGMWVESDTVMPSGESLVRQFLHGQRFFEREFGIRSRGVWLPDSFGYSPALPQLIRRAGFDWFFTQKISWNQTNTFPHHAFLWDGIDGTSVLTHFPPMDTYSARLSAEELARASRTFRENRYAPASIAPTGHGDGGGGTTREMVARQQRTANLEGSPRVRWQHPDDFFDELAALEDRLPRWSGELYLELHRGTLTTQHAMKQGNRRLENLLVEAELWAATSAVLCSTTYPHDTLDRLWEEVLLYQFHDILPGTSIAWVHREARERYAVLAAEAESVITRALAEVAGSGDIELHAHAAFDEDDWPPAGSVAAPPADVVPPARLERVDNGWLLENELVRVTISSAGLVTSAVDLATGRDAIMPGRAANLLQLHDDLPNEWDAWDVDRFYRHHRVDITELSRIDAHVTDGCAVVVVERQLSPASRVLQTLSLRPGSRGLRIDQETHWYEDERFLKLSFPLDVRAENSIAETQFGVVSRPTHTNTSWEDARFETSMHRFVLVEEPGFGVAVVNDSSYGYDIARIPSGSGWGVDLRVSVLRAPLYPDPLTDRGIHRHVFVLVIGADTATARRYAGRLASEPRVVHGAREVEPLVRVEGPGIALSTVKAAADRTGDIILRVHEYAGSRASGRIVLTIPISGAREVTLLEEPLRETSERSAQNGVIDVSLSPFEVQTWRITPARR